MNIQDKILAIKEELNELPPLAVQEIVFNLLETGAVDYVTLSEMYVSSLKKINDEKQVLICGLSVPLIHYYTNVRPKNKQDIFIKVKAAYNLLKTKMWPVGKMQELVDKYNYSEDENGHHKINL
jgi:hypothetical protein